MNKIVSQVLHQNGVDPETFRISNDNSKISHALVDGSGVVALWEAVRKQFPATGIWPIIRGGREEEDEEHPAEAPQILCKVPAGTVWQLLAERLQGRIENMSTFIDGLNPEMDLASFIAKVDASGAMSFGGKVESPPPWPAVRPATPLEVHSTLDLRTRKPQAHIQLALIEMQNSYEAPAHLSFGGWNDSPMPEIQVAMLREWARKFGAVPIAITRDVLECVVDRPPQTESEAMAIAAEQWIFCDDIVSQGTQTVRQLAIELWRSPKWFFWWD